MPGPAPAAWLEGSSPTTKGQRFDLGLESLRLGRGSTCSIALTDRMVSREHAEIRYQEDAYVIVDLGSSHGTFVDDQPVQEARLNDGARIRLGTTEFVFHLAQDAIPTAMLGAEGLPALPVKPAARPAAARPVPATPVVDREPAPASGPAAAQPQRPVAPKKSGPSRLLLACGALALLAICGCAAVAVVGVITGSGGIAATINQLLDRAAGAPYTLDDLALALAVPPVDERAEILENFGRPDEFDVAIVQVKGGQVRRESWRYYRLGTQVDFVDGVIVWTVDLEAPAGQTIFPAWYDPTDFETGMTISEATALLASASPAGSVPEAIDLTEGGEELAGSALLAGDQISVGFENGILVYVETLGMTLE